MSPGNGCCSPLDSNNQSLGDLGLLVNISNTGGGVKNGFKEKGPEGGLYSRCECSATVTIGWQEPIMVVLTA